MKVKQDSNLALPRNMKVKQDSNLAPSRKMKVKQDSNLAPSRKMKIKQDSNLAPSRKMKVKQDSNLAPSRKMKVKQDSNLAPSRNRNFELLNMKIDKMTELIKSELELHPKAQLIDYYKLFFQGTFGPGHIISDKNSALKFLRTEFDESTIFEEFDFQNISYVNNFYRVNLNVINRGMISFDDFLDAFLKSAELRNKISYEIWLEEWEKIEKQINIMKMPIEYIEVQSTELWKIIKNGNLVSHSEIYRNTYSPHYRLINAIQFKRITC